MAKFHGKIGYATSVETAPGVWSDQVTEREYTGDVLRESKQWTRGEQVNDNLTVSNRLSIIADDFANTNIPGMKYVLWVGAYWKITSVEVQRPRLILTLGGVYNGPKQPTP